MPILCPNCQTANPEGARFCMGCGTALAPASTCPNCGAAVLPGARYCHNCGQPLADSAQPSSTAFLQKFIPKELLLKVQAAQVGRSLEGERRIVTMLFCDVKGSTAMAEQLDPEEWAEIMNGAFEYLIPPVFRYEGMIPRMMGDAILAFFGAPIAHEDDPERAVRAGLEIVAGIQEYRQRLQRERGLDFDVRVGINTGLVVVGEVGTDLRLEYTAMGDAINLAARMEQTAQPGSVQISENTHRLVASLFEFEPLGGIAVKGKSEPVKAYRVIGHKPAPLRVAGITGTETPLVGRDEEMAALREKQQALRHGRGGIIFLIGEAGLGKSRLVAELLREWAGGEFPGASGAWDVVSAASFAASRPYAQFRQHLVEHMGILETDPPQVARQKVARMYSGDLEPLREQALAVFGRLLDIDSFNNRPGPDHPPAAEGEKFRQELTDLVLAFERIWIGKGPAVQVFEDLHWTDPSSAELTAHLLQLASDLPVLFVCTFRPDPGTPAWSIRRAAQDRFGDLCTEIVLGPLPSTGCHALIENLLSGASLPAGLEEQILEKAEGNPLFIEEVVRELQEQGSLEGSPAGLRWAGKRMPAQVAIPSSLQALLIARLDRLEDDARRTLQLASVIGRSFYYTVLQRIIDAAIQLDRELQRLQGSDLIVEAARQPELEFQFRHALTQEAAYQSILVKRRRLYHRRVAEALEALYAGHVEEHAELLAHHYAAAGDSRARHFYTVAGKKAAQVYASREAVDFFSRALELQDGAPTDEIIPLLEARGEIYFTGGYFEKASADFEAALDLARRAGRFSDQSRLLSDLAWLRWSSGLGAEALELARQAEAAAQAGGDPAHAQRAQIILGSALQNMGDLSGARAGFRKALLAAQRSHTPHTEALSLYYLCMLENFAGRFGRAALCGRAAFEMSLRQGNRLYACGALYYVSLAEGGRGRYEQALADLDTGRRMAEEMSSHWVARYPNQRAWLSAELGDWETAFAIDLAGLQPAQQVPGFREIEISTLINLALDCTALGRLGEAETYLAESQTDLCRPEFGSHNWRWSLRLADARARLSLARGENGAAAKAVAELLEQTQRVEARKYIARGLLLRAQVHLSGGDLPAAETTLTSAIAQADRICYLPVRVEARRLLASLLVQRGEERQSQQPLQSVADLITSLDAQLHHPELRLSFERGIGRKANPGV